jgi:phosphoribosylglycinamide formyltransferase-1
VRRVAVLVSGRGSNLGALIDAQERDELGPARLALVVADRACLALERAADAGLPTEVVRLRDYTAREDWNDALLDVLRRADIDIVVFAGFKRVLGPQMIAAFRGAILNVHPSLLPAFPGGLHAQADAIAYGVKVSGCTVHIVNDEVDAGPIVLQRPVEVRDDDDEASLAARILAEEHRALPQAVRLLAEGRLRVEGRRVRVLAPSPV